MTQGRKSCCFLDLSERRERSPRGKVCTKVLPFVPLGQRRGGGIKKRGFAPLKLPFNIFFKEEEKFVM